MVFGCITQSICIVNSFYMEVRVYLCLFASLQSVELNRINLREYWKVNANQLLALQATMQYTHTQIRHSIKLYNLETTNRSKVICAYCMNTVHRAQALTITHTHTHVRIRRTKIPVVLCIGMSLPCTRKLERKMSWRWRLKCKNKIVKIKKDTESSVQDSLYVCVWVDMGIRYR